MKKCGLISFRCGRALLAIAWLFLLLLHRYQILLFILFFRLNGYAGMRSRAVCQCITVYSSQWRTAYTIEVLPCIFVYQRAT